MGRRNSKVVEELCEKVHASIQEGSTIKAACEPFGIATDTYRRWLSLSKKATPVQRAKPSKRVSKIHVQDLPSPVMVQGKLFLVYGSPEMLSQFARGLA